MTTPLCNFNLSTQVLISSSRFFTGVYIRFSDQWQHPSMVLSSRFSAVYTKWLFFHTSSLYMDIVVRNVSADTSKRNIKNMQNTTAPGYNFPFVSSSLELSWNAHPDTTVGMDTSELAAAKLFVFKFFYLFNKSSIGLAVSL